jgi:putative PIN family toxin of toxin-antitoxin system
VKIVVDTNVLVSGIFWRGNPGRITEAVINGKCELLVTPAILSEYLRVIDELAGDQSADLLPRWSRFLNESATMVIPLPSPDTCSHVADQKFLESAVGGQADYLITGDTALLSIKETTGIPILTPRKMCDLLSK